MHTKINFLKATNHSVHRKIAVHNLWHNNKIKIRLFNPGTIIYGTIKLFTYSFRPKINYGTIIVIIIRTVYVRRKLGVLSCTKYMSSLYATKIFRVGISCSECMRVLINVYGYNL